MKNVKKSILLFLGLTLALTFCKAPQKTAYTNPKSMVTLDIPCSGPEYFSDENYMRSTSAYDHINMQAGKNLANQFAIGEIAQDIESSISAVYDNYRKTIDKGQDQIYEGRFEGMTRIVTEDVKTRTRTKCEKIQQNQETEKFRFYITREVSLEEIFNKAEQAIKNDEVLKIDYDYEKFKNVFSEEMERRRNNG